MPSTKLTRFSTKRDLCEALWAAREELANFESRTNDARLREALRGLPRYAPVNPTGNLASFTVTPDGPLVRWDHIMRLLTRV
jgi:hypothetical protein